MLLILTKVSIQVSDKYNFIEALSASIYQTAVGGSWLYYAQQSLPNISFQRNFPQVSVGDLQYPNYYTLKSFPDDYLFKELQRFEKDLESSLRASDIETLQPCFINAPVNFLRFTRSYALTLLGAMFSNYLNSVSADSYYERVMRYFNNQISSAPVGTDPQSLVSQGCNMILGPLPLDPTRDADYAGLGQTRAFFETDHTAAIGSGANQALKELPAQLRSGTKEVSFCNLFSATYFSTTACTHRLVDRTVYDYVVNNCSVDPSKISIKDTLEAAYNDGSCEIIFGETTLINLLSQSHTSNPALDPVDISSDTFRGGFAILVPVEEAAVGMKSSDLQRAYDAALAEMANDGTLQAIYGKFFNEETLTIKSKMPQQYPNPQYLNEKSTLRQILMKQRLNAYLAPYYTQQINGYELDVLKTATSYIANHYNKVLNLNISNEINEYNSNQNDLVYRKVTNCPAIGFDCQNTEIHVGAGLATRQTNQTGTIFSTGIYSGIMALIGNSSTTLCVLNQSVASNQETSAISSYDSMTQQNMNSYSDVLQAVAAGTCSFYTYVELAYALAQNGTPVNIADQKQTNHFVSFMFKEDSQFSSLKPISTYSQTLISWKEFGEGIYYTSILIMFVVLALIVVPITAHLIYRVTKSGVKPTQ